MELVQLPLKKKQRVGCENQEACILESVLRLETEFSKLRKQLLTSNGVQEELLKELKIYNKSKISKLETPEIYNKTKKLMPRDSDTGYSGLVEECQLTFLSVEDPIISGTSKKENTAIENSIQITDIRSVCNVQLEPTASSLDTQALVPAMPSYNEADNTNDPPYLCSDALLSIDEPFEINVGNPGVYLPEVKVEINETINEMPWPVEVSGPSETPCSRNDNTSPIKDTMQPESEVDDYDDGVVIKVQEVTDDRSVNVFNENYRFNQLTNPIDQAQSDGHTSVSCYKCEKCERLFVDEESFRRHMKAKHPDRSVMKRHKCEFCSFSSDKIGHLKNHLHVHTNEKPFQCTVCSKRFAQEAYLKMHVRIHSKECPHECNRCGKKFNWLSSMQRHIRIVHDEYKPFVCNVCGYASGASGHLHDHMSTHTGVRNYKCQYCNKKFARSENMRRHERIHTGEKPYKCKECSAAFINSSNLHKHIIIHHTKKYPYRCSDCDKGFLAPSELKRHESRCCKS